MQEEVENKTVNLAINTTKLTVRAVIKGLAMYMQHCKNIKAKKNMGEIEKPVGKQSVKQLVGQNQGVSSMPIGETRLKDFQRIAKKYGVDFAVIKDKTTQAVKYTVFFKARDADAITQVLQEYTQKQLKRKQQNKPSVLQKLKKFKDLVAGMPKKQREKRKELEL